MLGVAEHDEPGSNGISSADTIHSPDFSYNSPSQKTENIDATSGLDDDDIGLQTYDGTESDEGEYDTEDEFESVWSLDEDPSREDTDATDAIFDETLEDLTQEHLDSETEDDGLGLSGYFNLSKEEDSNSTHSEAQFQEQGYQDEMEYNASQQETSTSTDSGTSPICMFSAISWLQPQNL